MTYSGPEGKGAGKIKRIVYEHVGTGIDVSNSEPFLALASLLAPGGEFEYLSFWDCLSVTHRSNAGTVLNQEAVYKQDFLNQTLRFKTSYSFTVPKKENEMVRQVNALNDEIKHEFKDIIKAVGGSLPHDCLHKDQKTESEEALSFGDSGLNYNNWVKKFKTMQDKEAKLKELLNAPDYKNNLTTTIQYKGLDDRIFQDLADKVENERKITPYIIDLERDKEFFCQDSLLESNPKFFREVLKLQNVEASFHLQENSPNSPVCFGVKGSKPL